MKPTAPSTAFAVATLGIAVFSSMDAVMKGLSLAIGAYDALLWRSLAGTVIASALFLAARTPWPPRAVPRVHVLRALVSSVMAMLFFWGLARVPMAQAIALSFVAPLIALLLAGVLLKERIGRSAVFASAIALVGVAVIFTGQARTDLGPEATIGSLAVLASAVCYAWNIILMRQQALVARPIEIAFFQSAIVSVLFLLAAPLFGSVPDASHAPMLVLAAILATVSLMLLSWAYARGQASYLAPSEYTGFVWASLFGWIIFSERLSLYTLAGAALIIGACILSARAAPPLETNL